MKSKTNRFEKTRFRRDYLFSRLVTAFGLLVLAIFATLLLHLLMNAAPLLKSPNTKLVYSFVSDFAQSSLGTTQLQGQWVNVSVNNCSLYITSITDKDTTDNPSSEVIKKYAPNCSKSFVGLVGEQNQYVLMTTSDNLLEIYLLQSRSTMLLQSSVALPPEFTQSTADNWQVNLYKDILFIQQAQPNGILTLTHPLSSLDEPILAFFENAKRLVPLLTFSQVMVITENEMQMFNQDMQIIQRLPLTPNSIEAENPHDISSTSGTNSRGSETRVVELAMSLSTLDIIIVTNTQSLSSAQTNEIQKDEHQAILRKFTLVNKQGDFKLRETFSLPLAHEFTNGNVTAAFDLQHNAGFLVSEYGKLLLINIITGDIKLDTDLPKAFQKLNYTQGQLQITYNDHFELYDVENLQGMVSLEILFGKNDYSGYEDAQYVWQTSVSSAAQSPKYSVVPLIMGSLKASVLALIVALPLALGAAIYTAYFAPPHIRNAIKPSIEMLEAIPSVIIGFIAAVWLAPFAEQYLLSIFSVILLLPFVVLIIAAIHGFLQNKIVNTKLENWQLAINVLLLLSAVVSIFLLSLLMTDWSNTNGYHSLVESVSHLTLSKTAIVVSLALGVAIAPTIYTLIDDALFEVPDGVKQASFALGATQVQTLVKVVLVVALPSIISAVMLGFGRAFGETMIVLMVTGNTPIANWDLLSGLRTLTSNLAIELQEAPVDSTPYHILFFTAALLFAFTFVINTLAAILKRRMHRDGQ